MTENGRLSAAIAVQEHQQRHVDILKANEAAIPPSLASQAPREPFSESLSSITIPIQWIIPFSFQPRPLHVVQDAVFVLSGHPT